MSDNEVKDITKGVDKFNPEVLVGYSEGDKDFEKDLIDSYKQSITEHLPKLSESLQNNDVHNTILRSHDIKGSSSYIGAEAVRKVSEKMETLSKESNLKEAEKYLAILEYEIRVVCKLLDGYLDGIPLDEIDISESKEEDDKDKEDKEVKENKEEDKEVKENKDKEDKTNNKDDKKETENSTTKAATKKQDKD